MAPASKVLAACVTACQAEGDLSMDAGQAWAERLRAAGRAVALEIVRGVTHDFNQMGRALAEAGWVPDFAAAAFKRALNA